MYTYLSTLGVFAAVASLGAAQPAPTGVTVYANPNYGGEGLAVPADGQCGDITAFPSGLGSVEIAADSNIHCQFFDTPDCSDEATREIDESLPEFAEGEAYSAVSCFVDEA
ncbi:uncharacterized protein BDV14DRAFT_198360 [Aspergillus stella-maris]|uniref:uncharacterized protein n=1 Tax=Aspergillus stella-maris TaxID=1810926 RepID=UPI003CCD89B0